MKTFILLTITVLVCFLLASCQKEIVIMEKAVSKRITVQYFSATGEGSYRLYVNDKLAGDSLANSHPLTEINLAEKQHLVLQERATGRTLLDTTINSPGNKTLQISLLNLTGDPAEKLQVLVSEPVDLSSKKANFSFLLNNSSGAFPEEVNIKIVRFNADPETYAPDGTVDTLAFARNIKPGQLSAPVTIDIGEDPFYQGVEQLSPYAIELKNANTGKFLSGGEINSTFKPGLGYSNYNPEKRNYIMSVRIIPRPTGPNLILSQAFLSY